MATTTSALLRIILITALLSATTTTTATAAYTPSPFQPPPTPSLISTILSTLGFHHLSTAAANFTTTIPTTIFAPTDSSVLTCPSCSLPLLLQEHSLPGLYPLHYLRTLAFGTKIGSFALNRCLTITSTATTTAITTKKVFINGVAINKPDLFNNGVLIIHSLKGFLSHLSPRSCIIESMTSLSFPQQPPPLSELSLARLMLRDAMMKLRVSGYSLVFLAMRVRYPDLSELNSMTLFALDDESIFVDGGEGRAYVAELGFHVVRNRLLMAADLFSLPNGTELETMERGRSLVVTTAGDGRPFAPMRINYVKVKRFDMVYNDRIVVHGLSMPFRPLDYDRKGNSRFGLMKL